MNSSPAHILTESGVLTSFQVAKKVTSDEINKFIAKQKRAGKTPEQITQLLREKILKEVQDALDGGKIPGLLKTEHPDETATLAPSVLFNLHSLNRIVMAITEKMLEKQYDKMSMCYVINSMVNLLGLTAQDFEKFHQQRSNNEDDDRDAGTDVE